MNTYAAYHVMWGGVDPSGMAAGDCKRRCRDQYDLEKQREKIRWQRDRVELHERLLDFKEIMPIKRADLEAIENGGVKMFRKGTTKEQQREFLSLQKKLARHMNNLDDVYLAVAKSKYEICLENCDLDEDNIDKSLVPSDDECGRWNNCDKLRFDYNSRNNLVSDRQSDRIKNMIDDVDRRNGKLDDLREWYVNRVILADTAYEDCLLDEGKSWDLNKFSNNVESGVRQRFPEDKNLDPFINIE